MTDNAYFGTSDGQIMSKHNKNFVIGLVAGAAVATLLTNKKVQDSISNTTGKAWSTVRGEVEELKERLEDTQAELDYYRNLNKGDE